MGQSKQTDHPVFAPCASELVRLLAHDARTPLNAVRGFAELLLAGAGGPLGEAALGHVIEIARAGRAIESALGLAQQLAEFDAAIGNDRREIDLAQLLAEAGFKLLWPRAKRARRTIPVAGSAWRAVVGLCRAHLADGERSSPALLAEIDHPARHTLDLTLRGTDMDNCVVLSGLAERLLVALLSEAEAVLVSSAPHRPIVIRVTKRLQHREAAAPRQGDNAGGRRAATSQKLLL